MIILIITIIIIEIIMFNAAMNIILQHWVNTNNVFPGTQPDAMIIPGHAWHEKGLQKEKPNWHERIFMNWTCRDTAGSRRRSAAT